MENKKTLVNCKEANVLSLFLLGPGKNETVHKALVFQSGAYLMDF